MDDPVDLYLTRALTGRLRQAQVGMNSGRRSSNSNRSRDQREAVEDRAGAFTPGSSYSDREGNYSVSITPKLQIDTDSR
jgi:hypothetical protein